MKPDWFRCACNTAAADACVGDDTFVARDVDGSCNCSCHVEYSDDPQNWQPLCMNKQITDAEYADMSDWIERMDAAEALAE